MKRTLLYLWMISFIAGLAIPAGGSALAAGPPVFRISASAESILPNGQVTVKVSASGLPATSAYELRLTVAPIGTGQTAALTLLSERNLLPQSGFSAQSRSGDRLTFAYALQGGQPAVTGDADLASFTFSGTAAGQARITLTAVQLMDASLAATTHEAGGSVLVSVSDGTATPTPAPTGSPTAGPSSSGGPAATPSAGPGSSASPAPTPSAASSPLPTPTPAPAVIRLAAAEPDASGSSVVSVPAGRLAQAFADARGGTLRIVVEPSPEAAAIAVDLPLAQLREGTTPARIEIDAGLAAIAFDTSRLLALIGPDAGTLRFFANRVDTAGLPAAAREQLAGRPVYDFALTADGERIGAFGAGQPVTVSLPYAPMPGEAEDRIVAYFVGDDGRLEVVKHTAYDPAAGRLTFKPKHFSLYAVAEAPAIAFSDLERVPWAQPGIEALAARGMLSGVGADRFAPDRPVTRAEFVAMLMGVLDLSAYTTAGTFTDVKPDAWYAGAVSVASELGIALGRPDGSFGVRGEISRQDMAVMMARALRLNGVRTGDRDEALPTGTSTALGFADRAEISPYARDAVGTLQAVGILTGVGGGRIAPAESATRAQAAVMLYRLYGLL
ncbi:S-layer homology domain-containing protein [Cohnella sp. GCM10020058]|uniref:S-layer homology domain-containing protein n=1 Tax=Cohnella sp. GCM10020058 TaxID=3317330 RepID=UPI00362DC310